MNIGGCRACETCFKTGKACSFNDDFNTIAPAIQEADAVVFSTLVYWYSIPSQIKAVIDKLFSFYNAKVDLSGKECALITDGRFSGGTSGLSIGHISPEAAAGGNIGKIVDGDIIEIDIPARKINVRLTDEELAARPMTPVTRDRYVPKSLKAYASMVSSADKGAVRII